MLSKWGNDWRTGWVLAAIYIFMAFSLPCLPGSQAGECPVNTEHSGSRANPTKPILAPLKASIGGENHKAADPNKQHCGGGFICAAVWPRIAKIFDRSTDDPVALFTIILAISTIGLWAQTGRLAAGAEAQASDLKTQLDIVREDFVSTHRPWVAFTVKIGPQGLWYDAAGMHIQMMFECINKGSTPAIGVSVNARAYPFGPFFGELALMESTIQELGPVGLLLQSVLPHVTGTTIFPDGRWTFEKQFLIDQADLDKLTADPKVVTPCIVGCIDYGFSFGPLEPHQTRFILYLGKRDPARPTTLNTFAISEGPLKPDQLDIRRSERLSAFAVS